jgi:chromosome segregation protein
MKANGCARSASLQERGEMLGQVSTDWAEQAQRIIQSLEFARSRHSLLTGWITGLSVVPGRTDLGSVIDKSFGQALEDLHTQYEVLKKSYVEADIAWQEAMRSNERVSSLRAELMAIGRDLLAHAAQHDECPLCGTNFPNSSLLQKLNAQMHSVGDHAVATLASERDRVRNELQIAGLKVRDLDGLIEFDRRRGVASTTPNASLQDLSAAQAEATLLEVEILHLSEARKTLDIAPWTLDEIFDVIGVHYPPQGDIKAALLASRLETSVALSDTRRRVDELEREATEQLDALAELSTRLGLSRPGDILTSLIGLHSLDRQVRAASLALGKVSDHLHLSDDADLAEISDSIRSALLQTERLIEASENEASKSARELALSKRRESLEEKIRHQDMTIGRLDHALSVSSDLLNNHSLASATQSAMDSVHEAADGIFARIHLPSEYRINPSVSQPLLRKDTSIAASLSEVSTGQRAAYALSIFLAMNATSGTSAPKILLLDDPVAYVDDLNTLSFIDYLRDIAMHGGRQIFFATADDRLAGLFTHKFSFLKNEFQTIDLSGP